MEPASASLTRDDYYTIYQAYIPELKARGSDWRTACPIHGGSSETSFSINANNGHWFCHSACQRGGDPISFVQEVENCDFKEALKICEGLVGRSLGSKPETIKTYYEYKDEKGEPLFRVVRVYPKKFYQERYDKASGKYVSGAGEMRGVRRVLYNLPGILKSETVYLVEGEKDANTLISKGLCATTNSMGVGKWESEYTKVLSDKDVIIIPDTDSPGLKHAERVLGALRSRVKSVRVHILQGAKDITEWFEAGGTLERLQEDLRAEPSAEENEEEVSVQDGEEEERPADTGEKLEPNDLARLVFNRHEIFCDTKGAYYEYVENRWVRISEQLVLKYAMAVDNHENTSSKRRMEIAKYIQSYSMRKQEEFVPWRQGIKPSEIAFKDRVFDLETWDFREHRKEDLLETYIPSCFDPEAKAPRWMLALEQWFEGNEEAESKKLFLQEYFGYVLMPEARYKRSMFLFGPSDTGKSVAIQMLVNLVGKHNACEIKPQDMGDPRRLAPIRGKMLNVVFDLSARHEIEGGGFKSLVSAGDMVLIDQKYQAPEFYRPQAKHVFSANEPPVITDGSEAIFNRIVFLGFSRVFTEREQDRNLIDALSAEIPGITAWAVEGAKRLYNNNGVFTSFKESSQLADDVKRSGNPAFSFLEDNMSQSPGSIIPFSLIHERFKRWHGRAITHSTLEGMLRRAGVKIGIRKVDGIARRHVIDMRMADGTTWKFDPPEF